MPEQLPLFSTIDLPRTNEQIDAANAPVECPCCGDEVAREDTIDHDGEPHCAGCVHGCENCTYTTTDADDLAESYVDSRRHVHEGSRMLCADCRWACADCAEWFDECAHSSYNSRNEIICRKCADHYHSCEDCHDIVHEDDARATDGGGVCCLTCYTSRQEAEAEDEDEDSDPSDRTRDDSGDIVIASHGSKPAPLFHDSRCSIPRCRPSDDIPYFGVEVEVDRPRKGDRVADIIAAGLHPPAFWRCEEDGSLDMGGDDSGFEVISMPATWTYWQKTSLAWMDALRARGWRSYDTMTCGMHVHVSRSFVTKLDQFKLLAFFRQNVALIRRLSRRKGGESEYARFDTSSTAALCQKVKYGPRGRRYEAINLENLMTVEFRLFRGTLNPVSFLRNLSLVVALVYFAKWAGFRQLNAVHFRVWVKVEGRHILGKADASVLVTWLNECISGDASADEAA